jgi:hypothetical protein
LYYRAAIVQFDDQLAVLPDRGGRGSEHERLPPAATVLVADFAVRLDGGLPALR